MVCCYLPTIKRCRHYHVIYFTNERYQQVFLLTSFVLHGITWSTSRIRNVLQGYSMTSRSDISLNNIFCLLSIQFTNMLCESWTHGIGAHTFDIRLQLKLFKFPVNYFLEEFICEMSRSDGVFSHKCTSRYTNLYFSSSNMYKWN